ncbi:MAG TPA: hypothetical protein DDY14_00715 [Chromatiaceae bacterium]|jgi:uncharacterized membrane protein YjjB (DUF3815 family)|nr:MAG: hypothetical protein N838_33075 [Thiohalocapsa sp. PB-PSB1]QQO57047.1 MAG: hypothetical protein N838_30545 [Thiohalocapsa sp. PB-PSB1]HBG93856.1 hypothetical protein [Chromatiaceae bacterium]HCS91232.1 hypothetical protein [Chromatiaceae bacterium]
MIVNNPRFITGLATLSIIGTLLIGWLSLLMLGLLAGVLFARQPRLFLSSALAGGSAWLLLLLCNALFGEAARLATAAGGVLGMPGWAFVLLTVTFAALLTGCAAVSAGFLTRAWSDFRPF